MAKAITSGKCESCGMEFSKSQMTRHLAKCVPEHQSTVKPRGKLQSRETLHLLIEGFYQPEYWIHVETPSKTRFGSLDHFLRDLWLECCGHLSAFTLPKRKKVAAAPRGNAWGMMTLLPWEMDLLFNDPDELMDEELGGKISSGDVFSYGSVRPRRNPYPGP
jgi:hypothetical protein